MAIRFAALYLLSLTSRIIGFEATVVKSIHPLGVISPQLEIADAIRVELEHAPEDRATPRAGTAPAPPADFAAPVDDPAEAAELALESPLNYPSLADGIVPGDQLAIAVDEAVPQAAEVVRGVVSAAEHAGIERSAITIVANQGDFLNSLRDALQNGATGPAFVVHDPDDELELCIVGFTAKNERLLVNRALYEADVVLPIGCARLPGVAGSGGVYESLFPRFCDAATIERLRTPSQLESTGRQSSARRRADEAGWLLGVPLVIQVVPGSGGSVADVVAGDPTAVAEYCEQRCRQLWSWQAPRRASLVIANVTGGPAEQTWENIARSLSAVEPLVAEGGAIAICSDLEEPPGQSLGRLIGCDDWPAVERDARNDHSADSWPAWQLARALQRGPVYFLSQLDDDMVEGLGLAPVGDIEELARLAGRQESCIVLDDSQHAVATVAGDSP